MKNILVPTDFTLQSLSIIHEIVNSEEEKVNIHLFHMVLPSNDLTELFFQRKSHLYGQVPDAFTEALQVLKNKYLKQIGSITIQFYYGNRVAVVNDIVESNNIDSIYLLVNHHYRLPLASSVDMVSLAKKCKLPVEMVVSKTKSLISQSGSISSLLVNQQGDIYLGTKAPEKAVN